MYITSKEMSLIKAALLYAAEQVHCSDIPVFEPYEDMDCIAGKVMFNEDQHAANEADAEMAEELFKKLDRNNATGHNWDCFKVRGPVE